MRPLESVALLCIAAALLLFLIPARRRPTWARWVVAAAPALLLLQLFVEGHRWQMDLAYGLGLALVVAFVVGQRRSERAIGGWRHAGVVVTSLGGVAVLLASFALAAGLPMFELPAPTGPHAVGVTELYVADPERPEIFTPDPNDHRELMLRVWYPAALPGPDAEPVAYWEDTAEVGPPMGRLTREVLGLSTRDNASDHYANVRTHSYRDASPIASPARLPVLVFSHGYGLARPQANTALMEELASRGYWIASIAHTFETPAVVFEDGRVVHYDGEAIAALLKDDGDSTFFTDYATEPDAAERDRIARRFLATQTASSRSMKVWSADTRTVVDELERLASGERESPFAGRLDLGRLGVFGMSFGGATAGVFCVEDARCKAGLNLDGFHYGDGMADAVVSVPFMIVSARREGFPINDFFFRHAKGPIYHVTIDGSTHMNFTDSSISAPLMRRLGVLGEIDGQRMLQLVNTYVSAFFDHHLLGASAELLERSSADFPEVELESRNR